MNFDQYRQNGYRPINTFGSKAGKRVHRSTKLAYGMKSLLPREDNDSSFDLKVY